MPNNYLKHKKGIALIEVVAALGIAVVVITSLVSLAIFTMRSSLRSKLLLEGTKRASRQIELMRAYRDNPALSWDALISNIDACISTNPCNVDEDLVVNSGTKTDGILLEAVESYFFVSNKTNDSIDITAVAKWKIGGEDKSTHIYTTLTNWREK